MKPDFSLMKVGDKLALPEGKWGDRQRAFYDLANDFCRDNPGVQFQTEGDEGSAFEKRPGQYFLVRTK